MNIEAELWLLSNGHICRHCKSPDYQVTSLPGNSVEVFCKDCYDIQFIRVPQNPPIESNIEPLTDSQKDEAAKDYYDYTGVNLPGYTYT